MMTIMKRSYPLAFGYEPKAKSEEANILLAKLFSGSNWLLVFQASVRGKLRGFIGCFPSKVGIAAPEVSVRCSLAINWPAQIERLNNLARLELEVCPHHVRN